MTQRPKRTRVLHLVQNLNYGGMERLIADIVRLSNPEIFESHVMALQYLGRFAGEAGEGTRLHLAEPLSRWSLLRPAGLARQIAAIGPDVVHSHSGVWYKAAVAAKMAGVSRVIHTEHGRRSPDPLSDRLIDRLAARSTDVVVAVSDALGAHLKQHVLPGGPLLKVVRNGVDTELYRPGRTGSHLRDELGVGPNTPIIGSIGRFEAIKGYDVMVEAFVGLSRSWSSPSAPHLVLAGDGSERERLEREISAAGLFDRVHFMGWRDDVPSLHAAFTIFTLASHSEGTSVSLLEAMSSGLCPVVTDVGGNGAVLGGSLSHRLVPAANARALADAWRDALTDEGRRLEDGETARSRVLSNFRLDQMVQEYESLYRGSSSAPPPEIVAAAASHI